ncbi:hypothetical protein FHS56_001306 [Thermonema lapsum]|uniref:Uncharacterized protein n=1 Tax=Thermonema lapsum TaxID=28195 RepID=A0A846MQF5_9BACT|nr:hypothetical protein [Thermonema lapsum]
MAQGLDIIVIDWYFKRRKVETRNHYKKRGDSEKPYE